MINLKGLVLAGGESKRMGTDKGLKSKDGEYWVNIVANKLANITLPVKVSINITQLESYQNLFQKDDLILDQITIPGPLRGILSAHLKYPEQNWLVLACDMIDMDKQTIQNMINAYETHEDFDFYVYQNDKFYEPFCGIYTAQGLAKLQASYLNNNLDNYSMQHVFETYKTYVINLKQESTAFNNYNK
ncbi:molybdenum cofactor guanylyltransferase [Pedobacter cryophilus]|uniref:Molybdenum cofactor guanylyltransferase n=1 Tax=Pedobacter cryophilus TaxID=2571271 RepID=A0A4U1BYM1_9SPHI|nr:molybdenum cofactor guanylyltransferase [Pedobacter cryophilus]TKB97591.1 molybdenum cofactor guanylyltransferase [Pedobacter cryophilus]